MPTKTLLRPCINSIASERQDVTSPIFKLKCRKTHWEHKVALEEQFCKHKPKNVNLIYKVTATGIIK